MSKIDKRWIWVGLGVLSIFLRYILGFFPWVVEQYYTRGLFQVFRVLWDYTLAWSPVPLVYILFVFLVIWLIKSLFKKQKYTSIRNRLGSYLLSLVAFVGGFVFLFLTLWGYNYGRVKIEEHLGIDPVPLELPELKREFARVSKEVTFLRQTIPSIDTSLAIDASYLPADLEFDSRINVEKVLLEYGFPAYGRVRGRQLYPKGILLRISTAGIYIPFVAEGHIDAGLHPLQKPFTMAHEMMHGYGFTDEGTCNFLAYLACKQSEKPIIRYAGMLTYWRYLASSYRRMSPEDYKKARAKLPEDIQRDLWRIYENGQLYPDILPHLRDAAYDSYLKTQGIKEGMKSYNRIVMLVHAYNKEYN